MLSKKQMAEYLKAREQKAIKKIEIADLKANLSNLRELQEEIISLSTKEFATEILLDAAFSQVAMIQEYLKEFDGEGFKTVEDMAERIYAAKNSY